VVGGRGSIGDKHLEGRGADTRGWHVERTKELRKKNLNAQIGEHLEESLTVVNTSASASVEATVQGNL